jgi:hypothetical protein
MATKKRAKEKFSPYDTADYLESEEDMVAVVSTARLDLFRLHRRREDERREYLPSKLGPEQLDGIRRGVAHALGLGMIEADPERGFRD